jgi:hypothetical protein
MTEIWSAIAAISAACGTLIVLAAAVYAYLQVREARLARTMSILWAFHDRYHSDPLRTFRRRLIGGELGGLDQLDAADIGMLANLIDQLEFLGILVNRKLLDFDLVVTVFPYSPPRVRKAVESYILPRRRQPPHYGAHFEEFIRRYRQDGIT